MSAPSSSPRPSTPPTPRGGAGGIPVPTLFLVGAALGLAAALLFLPQSLRFFASLPAGLVGATACELAERRQRGRRASEPFRFDGYCVLLLTAALLGLGAGIGPEIAPLGWLLVTLLLSLAIAAGSLEAT